MYYYFKDLVPTFCPKKARKEEDLLVAMTRNLDVVYLNATAASFCIAADGKATVDEIVQQMLNEYEVDAVILQKDVCHLIRDLQWKKLIRLRHSEI